MKIKLPHCCPVCRIERDFWEVPESGLKKKQIRPGSPWPRLEPIHTEAVDTCQACNTKMFGKIIIKIDEHGDPKKLLSVKEVKHG